MSVENPGPLMKTFLFLSTVWIALPIIVIQNLLGMYLNLWLDFSDYSSLPRVFSSVPPLGAHVAVGLLILSLTTGRVATTFYPQNRPFMIPSISIFLSAVLAFFSGVAFTFFGNDDLFSFTMELGFGGIIVSVAGFVYVATRVQRIKGQVKTPPPS